MTTSIERVTTALSHREADRVPFFLMLSLHGARELGLGIREYFARPANVVEAQLRMQARYGHDCLDAFFYASIEMEAWGGETIFRDGAPPNAGAPLVRRPDDVMSLETPRLEEATCLHRVLEAITLLSAGSSGVPVVGVVVSPFSLPVMQLGFERYLDILHERPDLLEHLLRVNEEFTVAWGNAQVRAGATALCWFDPCLSPTMIAPDLMRRTGLLVARRTIARLRAPVVAHLASGRALPVVPDLATTGAVAIGVGPLDDLRALKDACRGQLALVGTLNGVEMRRWDPSVAEATVKATLAAGAPGGGFILCDAHGEIPPLVPDDVVRSIAEAAHRWGTYPLSWVAEEGR